MLQSLGQNRKWPKTTRFGYIIDPDWLGEGVPNTLNRHKISKVAPKWMGWLHNRYHLGGGEPLGAAGQHKKWPKKLAVWLPVLCHLRGPQCFKA